MQTLPTDVVLFVGLGDCSESVADAFGPGISIDIKPLGEAVSQPVGPARLSVFLANLGSTKSFEAVKACAMRRREDKFFVLPTHTSDNQKRLRELDAAEVFVFPLDRQRLRRSAKFSMNRQVEASWANLVPEQHKALSASLTCFQDFFN